MKRFEIQEMVSQSEKGVAYLAHDKQSQREVALRRFFPFGRDADGLNPEQQNAYCETCQKLMSITHTNLRFVIDGGVDPSDGTPYLATEWVEGNSLSQILAGSTLDPGRTIDIVRCALEVSLELSAAFGEQAVWVETDLSSVVVGNAESDRGYTFWVCPLRWFNVAPKLREVSSLAHMAEELIGWNNKLYSKEAAGGFGGWVKDMKSSLGISAEEALKQLNALLSRHQPKLGTTASTLSQPVALARPKAESPATATTKSTPPTPKPVPKRHPKPVAKPAPQPTARPVARPVVSPAAVTSTIQSTQPARTAFGSAATQPVALAPSSQGKSKSVIGALMFIAACLALAAGLLFMVQKNRAELRDQLAKNEAIAEAEEKAKKGSVAAADGAKPPMPSTQVSPTLTPNTTPKPNSSTPSSDARMFTPDEKAEFNKIPHGTPVKLRGVVRRIHVDAHRTILIFDDGRNALIRAYTWKGKFEGNRQRVTFEPFRGREIIVEGYVNDGRNVAPKHVLFTRLDQISLVDEEPAKGADPGDPADPESAVANGDGALIFPNQLHKMRDIDSGNPVKLSGTLKEVNQDGKVVVLKFGIPTKNQPLIYGRADADQFEGELNSEMFREYIGKRIVIEGTFVLRPNWAMNSHYVEFVRPSQVKLRGQ